MDPVLRQAPNKTAYEPGHGQRLEHEIGSTDTDGLLGLVEEHRQRKWCKVSTVSFTLMVRVHLIVVARTFTRVGRRS
jgi:hypothetical protein